MTYSFLNDYSESAHPDILAALQDSHLQQHVGYGFDDYSEQVREILRGQLGSSDQNSNNPDDIAIHFGITGTQANLVCIAAMLSPIDGIIACTSGHIAVNEAGAIEATGHKVITTHATDGKLTVAAIEAIRQRHTSQPHVVRAKAVYISNTTELGTVYSYDELAQLSAYCRDHNMYLFIDGARLGAALASDAQQVTLADIAKFADIFWLGGTKMGAMFGEVIIIPNRHLALDFNVYLKQHGGLLAKGYLLALQFEILLKDNKYLEMCRHANSMAQQLATALQDNGHELFVEAQSNQVFAILPQAVIDHLQKDFAFYAWEKLDNDRSVVRFVTSWATPQAQIDRFVAVLREFSKN